MYSHSGDEYMVLVPRPTAWYPPISLPIACCTQAPPDVSGVEHDSANSLRWRFRAQSLCQQSDCQTTVRLKAASRLTCVTLVFGVHARGGGGGGGVWGRRAGHRGTGAVIQSVRVVNSWCDKWTAFSGPLSLGESICCPFSPSV